MTPTQTMHYYNGNPSKLLIYLYTCVLFDSLKMGSLMNAGKCVFQDSKTAQVVVASVASSSSFNRG